MADMHFEDKFDELIHNQLAGYEHAPAEGAWNKLDGVLSKNRVNNSAMRKLNNVTAAVSLSAVLFCGIAILKNKETVAPVSNTTDTKTEQTVKTTNQSTTVVETIEVEERVEATENEVAENNNVIVDRHIPLSDRQIAESITEEAETTPAEVPDTDNTEVVVNTEEAGAATAGETTVKEEVEKAAEADEDKTLLDFYSEESTESNELFKQKEK